jgi:hypothetical protein
MALLPVVSEEVIRDFEYHEEPSLTYKMNVELDNGTAGRIVGYVDGLKAVEQSVYKILNTERGENEIYNNQYGVELDDLMGKPMQYVIPEIDRRIKEALLMDDRVKSVGNFKFEIPKKGVLSVSFTVISIYGSLDINQALEV